MKRIEDAIRLKKPDRVPVFVDFGYLAARYSGMTYEEVCYDPLKWAQANRRITLDFQPDMVQIAQVLSVGKALEDIDTKIMKWPGHGVSPNQSHQYIEGEYMNADEYDNFLKSPGDFVIRTYLPRVAGALESFGKLPSLIDLAGIGRAGGALARLASPEFTATFESMLKAGREIKRWDDTRLALIEEIECQGIPCNYLLGGVGAPFDFISDFFRGMRGTMLDMYRQPAKLLAGMETVLPYILESIKGRTKRADKNNLLFIAPHRGADGFMSLKQFETFYWPGLKAVINALVDAGFTPYVFWEGNYTSRLEYLLELPRGKILGRFDRTDIIKTKHILGGHMCLAGGVMPSLLQTGNIQDVKEHCRKLIETAGRDGGFILSTSVVLDEARPENVKAMIDSATEYIPTL
jgi:hypothetical protein